LNIQVVVSEVRIVFVSASSTPRTSSLETRLFEKTKTCTQGRLETCGGPGQPNNLEPPSNRNYLKFSAWKYFDGACLNSANLRRNYFTCGKPSLLTSHFWLFQWCLQRPGQLPGWPTPYSGP